MAQSDLMRAFQTVDGVVKKVKSTKHTPNWSYGLTELGRIKVEQQAVSGSKWEVMSHLYDYAPCSKSELCEKLHMSPLKIKEILERLINTDGYVSRIPQSA